MKVQAKIITVSIHALLAECDLVKKRMDAPGTGFNPRTPCGVRLHSSKGGKLLREFQSTHSLRSATCRPNYWRQRNSMFQSTHSLRSATIERHKIMSIYTVSIHALLAECDRRNRTKCWSGHCFNPRTPCGVRHDAGRATCGCTGFQSTHSLRSATYCARNVTVITEVSIHALLAECDAASMPSSARISRFNPRTPCGVRQAIYDYATFFHMFQSTHSLRSATGCFCP